jgi:DHA1 family bicyclomycin/chloramphenicol resistance-like MFS transporter
MTLLLTALVAFGALSNNIYLPSLPAMSQTLGVPMASVMVTISAFFVGFGLGQMVYGSLSDRYGRRPVLIGGLVVYTLASLVCALAPDIDTLIAARLAQGLAAAAAQVLARAIVRDLYTPVRAARMMSIMSAVFAVVPGFAPVLGGVLEAAFGWRATFVTLTLIGALVSVAAWRGLGESLREKDPRALDTGALIRNYGAILKNRIFLGFTLSFAGIFAGMFSFHGGSSFVFIDIFGFGPAAYGLFFMIVVMGYFIGSVISARTTMRIGYGRLVAMGAMVAICGGGAMLILTLIGFHGWWAIVVPQFIFMIGTGMIMPNAIAGALAPFPEKAGAASALFGFIQQMTGASVAVIIGLAADGTELPMITGIFAGAIAALAAYGLVARQEPRKVLTTD